MARRPTPWTIRIDSRLLTVARGVRPFLRTATGDRRSGSKLARLFWQFAFKSDELPFARQLLARKGNIWLFRSNQQRLCGDFVLVDMSSPDPSRRPVMVVDLKRGAPLREGGGGTSNQLANAHSAVERLAQHTEIIPRNARYRLWTGDRSAALQHLGVRAAA